MVQKQDYPSFRDFYEASAKEGNIYMYQGSVKGGYTPLVYGTDAKRIMRDENGKWDIGQGGIFPTFEKDPELYAKDMFVEKMKALGVPKEILEKFFDSELTTEDF